ncbi:hypothetical protein FB451DRAFT_1266223 [Mycena latifolia]|nr:hypothetical protein FB451DRAFT_1266223 [Mycena latifolia]
MQSQNDPDAALFLNHQMKTEAQLAENATLLDVLRTEIEAVEGRFRALEEEIPRQTAREAALKLELGAQSPHERADVFMQELRRLKGPVMNKEIGDLQREIKNNRGLLQLAGKQRKPLYARIKALQRATAALCDPITIEAFRASPVRRVPADILLTIFVLLKPDEIQLLGAGIVPVLAHVCAEWRNLACDYAVLWSSFACDLQAPTTVNLVNIYLQRGKNMPLTIIAHNERRKQDDLLRRGVADVEGVLAALAAQSERLYSLQLVGSLWSSAELQGFHGKLPHLEVLRLDSLELPFVHEFEIAPRLHTLILENTSKSPSVYPNIPCAQICSLHLERGTGPFGLANFANLTSLTCTMQGMAFEGPGAIPSTLLPRLARWRVDFRHKSNTPPNFFDHFTTPALESLEILSLTLPAQIAAFLLRSRCNLKHLVLHKSWVAITELLQICERSPRLLHFAVQDSPASTMVMDRLLEPLTASADRTALLPELKSLIIEGTYMFHDANLLEMLESRGTLNVVRLVLPDRMVAAGDVG